MPVSISREKIFSNCCGTSAPNTARSDLVRAAFRENAKTIAAVILEPIPANAGLYFPRENFLELLRDECTKHGALRSGARRFARKRKDTRRRDSGTDPGQCRSLFPARKFSRIAAGRVHQTRRA